MILHLVHRLWTDYLENRSNAGVKTYYLTTPVCPDHLAPPGVTDLVRCFIFPASDLRGHILAARISPGRPKPQNQV